AGLRGRNAGAILRTRACSRRSFASAAAHRRRGAAAGSWFILASRPSRNCSVIMSRNFAVLGKAAATPAGTRHPSEATLDPRAGANAAEFGELVRRLLPGAEVVAVISSGPADDATAICEGIAAEFSRAGKRVVLVSVDKLLPMDIVTLPDENAFMPGPSRNIWLWPSPVGQQIEFFKPRAQLGAENWLDLLRRNFDFVVLDCPSPQTAPLSAAIA